MWFEAIIFNQRQEESAAAVFQIHLLTATPRPLAAIILNKFLMIEEKEKPKNLYEYLKLIRFRLPMFIGSKSLKDLQVHISGFQTAEWIYDVKDEINSFMVFHDFVANEYKLSSSGEGWPKMILDKSEGDEDSAIIEFYRLLDLFQNRKIKSK